MRSRKLSAAQLEESIQLKLATSLTPLKSESDSSHTQRLCRVALLPDCHVRPGVHEISTRPTKRLYGAARMLLECYLDRLPDLDVDAIFLLGDTLDPADERGIDWLRQLMDRCRVPVHLIIGNHELYGPISKSQFHLAFELPTHGNYVADVNGVPFLMLATTDQDSLAPESVEYHWLEETLAGFDRQTNLFCCAHFSLILHPCVQGFRNDGMQVLWTADSVFSLLRRFPNVRVWIAGHKNVPSKVIQHGLLHLLSPQLIQAPCGYRILDIYPNGLSSKTYEIDEQNLAELSRLAYGDSLPERLGNEGDRDFCWSWHAA